MAIHRLLITRTDKLGDFMLTWPALADARAALPDAQIDVLVAPAVEAVARACPFIDDVIVDAGGSLLRLRTKLRERSYDSAVALFSTARVAQALWGAGIPYRLAPATKLHQLFFNQRLKQRRSRSTKPEYEYNRDLIRQLLVDHTVAEPEERPSPPFWRLDPGDLNKTADNLRATYGIPNDAQLIIIHPGSGGSARNLSIEQYALLANQLRSKRPLFILVTAGPGEAHLAHVLKAAITQHSAAVYESKEGLVAFAHVLAQAALYVSGSTGPLHMAGALDVPTLAFYPRRRSSTSLRWQTTNEADRRLAFSPPDTADELDMQSIDVSQAAAIASQHFLDAHRD